MMSDEPNTRSPSPGLLMIISGPSGVGKTTLIERLNEKFDFTAMIDEWIDETMRELDFVNEAQNTELVRHNLVGIDGVKIPKVVRSAGVSPTERTLVLEFVEGDKITTTTSAFEHTTAETLVETLTAAYAQQIFVDGVFNADPHPGNLMVERATGQLVLLDFGLTKYAVRRSNVLQRPRKSGCVQWLRCARTPLMCWNPC